MIRGTVLEITDLKTFDNDGKDYTYRNILFDLGDNKLLHTTLWGNRKPPYVGQVLVFDVDVTSERNKKDPSIFYHKVKLKYYEDYDRALLKKISMDKRVRQPWEEDATW